EVVLDPRGLRLLPRAEHEARGVLPARRVDDRVPAEKDVENVGLGGRALHRRRDPEDGIVLLLQVAPGRARDDLQDLHGFLLQRVPITSVLSDAHAAFQRSAGLPRRTPSMASFTPRSSTQSPQLIQSRRPPFRSASAMTAAIQSFGRGWSSA